MLRLSKFVLIILLLILIFRNNIFRKIEEYKVEMFFNKDNHYNEISNIVLDIPKINLKKIIYLNKYNSVDYGIELVNGSDMPDIDNGNFIVASHSGNSVISYFNKLDLLSLDDIVKVYYNNKWYKYKIINIYEIESNGFMNVKYNNFSSIYLITCSKKNDNQVIYLGKQL